MRCKEHMGSGSFCADLHSFGSRKVALVYAQMFVKKGHPSSIFRNERCPFLRAYGLKLKILRAFPPDQIRERLN